MVHTHVYRYECSPICLERELKGMNILKLVRCCQIFPKGLYQFIPINMLSIPFLYFFKVFFIFKLSSSFPYLGNVLYKHECVPFTKIYICKQLFK